MISITETAAKTAIAALRAYAVTQGADARGLELGYRHASRDEVMHREWCCRFGVHRWLDLGNLLAVLRWARAAACELGMARGIDVLDTAARALLAAEIWYCTGLAPLPRPSLAARAEWRRVHEELAADERALAIVDGAVRTDSRHESRAAHARVRWMAHRAAAC